MFDDSINLVEEAVLEKIQTLRDDAGEYMPPEARLSEEANSLEEAWELLATMLRN